MEVKTALAADVVQAIGAILVALFVGAILMTVPQLAAAGALLTLVGWLMIVALIVSFLVMFMKFFR